MARVFLPSKYGIPDVQDRLAVSPVMHSEQALKWTAIKNERTYNQLLRSRVVSCVRSRTVPALERV